MSKRVSQRTKGHSIGTGLVESGVRPHPRRADARPERVHELAGFFHLNGPAPSRKFLDESEEERADSHAGG